VRTPVKMWYNRLSGVSALARRKKKGKSLKVNLRYELYGIIILMFSALTLAKGGPVQRSLGYMFEFLLGVWGWMIPVAFIYIGLHVMIKRDWPRGWSTKKTGILLFALGLIIMSHMSMFKQLNPLGEEMSIVSQSWIQLKEALKPVDMGGIPIEVGGGMLGAVLYAVLYSLFGNIGSSFVMYTLFILGFVLVTGWSYVEIGGKLKRGIQMVVGGLDRKLVELFYLLRPEKKSGKKVKKAKKPAPPPMMIEDELDDDELEPIVIRDKKKPAFFELFKSRNEEEPVHTSEKSDLEDSEEQVVFQSESPEDDGHSVVPVIRDFQDHADYSDDLDEPAIAIAPVHSPVSGQGSAPSSTISVKINNDSDLSDIQAEEMFVPEPPVKVPYEMPSYHLLSRPAAGKGGESLDYKATARKLEATMESFGVRAKVLEVVRGPSVTRYEIQPDVGVKVSRIVGLTDDIALALAAKDIRMEAPIPGKSAIGIEVPNTEVAIVTLREVMESAAFNDSASKLTIALGRDISGQAIVGNLARMPHLLVAGATGSGKSVCINGIITSILFKAKPDEVKFLMIDPKMVELNTYNGIPHLLAPVVTDPRRASLALKKIVVEMEKRYELFSKSGTRNIEGYNNMLAEKKDGTEPLPYIVVIVDELADLMMVAAGDVEDAICRLAQMARAAGIHLIIATQRPSVDVITGVIKANIPSRIAFGVSSQVDSRTILDMVGAEKLLGRGDMLFLPMGASKPIRVQGAFLSDHEVETVVQFCSTQGKAEYREEMVPEIEESTELREEFEDELYENAVQIVLEAKQASVSLLQRRMRVGYTRAARLIDTMEAKGIVGPYEGSKPREVLVSMEQYQHNRMTS
jgi:DNA segregation ATPase FtsK/SpoIIIE, S-DNA-T family